MKKPDMSKFFSDAAGGVKASDVRELLKILTEPDVISFAGGIPDPLTFPRKELVSIFDEMVADDRMFEEAFQYRPTEGIPGFRKELVEYVGEIGIRADVKNILLTSGSQQALYAAADMFINPGDAVVVGSPTYLGLIGPVRMRRGKFATVELEQDGMKIEELKGHLESGVRPKFLYIIPNFENPSGVTTSLKKRKQIYELACEHDFLILEDDPYWRLRYRGKDIPSIKSFDDEERVMHLGSFSKVFTPGTRVGFMIAREDIVSKFTLAKQSYDLQTNSLGQWLIWKYLERGDMPGHIKATVEFYKKKMLSMLDALEREFPEDSGFTWTRPDGGMFLWMTGPEGFDARKTLEERLLDKKYMKSKGYDRRVAYVPGDGFYAENPKRNTMRINFSKPTVGEIEEGIRILSEVLAEG
ncbi:MAG: PLP-dependent aminotransferase family protein [archaeon]